MAKFLEEYLEAGLSQIFVIGHRHKEEKSGFQNEHTHEAIVAYDGTRFVRVDVHESVIFAPPGSRDFSGVHPEEITEAEYRKLSEGIERTDTPDVLRALNARKIAREESSKASKDLAAITPKCPKCGNQLTSRKGLRGRFWGCQSYPGCNGTAPFTDEHHRLYRIAARFN
jgi:Topoisomerase DNA binding C4 zinc finger